MFVFKAGVVGAGVMGGEIAQVIASADIPVLLKDVKQEFVDKGLEKARQVTEGQVGKLVKKEKLTQEQADAQLEHTLGLIGYVAILAALARDGERERTAVAFLSLAGFGFSAWLTYVEVAKLDAICIWCVGSAVCMTILAVLSVARVLSAPPPALRA